MQEGKRGREDSEDSKGSRDPRRPWARIRGKDIFGGERKSLVSTFPGPGISMGGAGNLSRFRDRSDNATTAARKKKRRAKKQ